MVLCMNHLNAARISLSLPSVLLGVLLAAGGGCQSNRAVAEQGRLRPPLDVHVTDGDLSVVDEIPGNLSPDERQAFYRLPRDAARFLEEIDFHSLNSPFSERLYRTAAADAEYALLREGRRLAGHDFVSDYDFMAASLDDLPFMLVAQAGIAGRQWLEFVGRLEENRAGFSVLEFPASWTVGDDFEFTLHETPLYSGKDLASARLVDGYFHGSIEIRDGILAAFPEGSDPGTRLLEIRIHSVTFSDVNSDGYLDAVLRLAINDNGSTAVLSRTRADQSRFDLIPKPW